MSISIHNQFLVLITCCGVEKHQLIIDQKWNKFQSFQHQLKVVFRQLPRDYILFYCERDGIIQLNSQEKWEEFRRKGKGNIQLFIVEDMKTLFPINDLIELFLSQLFSFQCIQQEYQLQSYWCPLEVLHSLLKEKHIQDSSKQLFQLIIDSLHQFTQVENTIDIHPVLPSSFHMEFIKDITFPSSSIQTIKRNEKHIKIWRVRNNGNLPWPSNCFLQLWNYHSPKDQSFNYEGSSFPIPTIIRNNIIEISYQFTCFSIGYHSLQFRLYTSQHIPFGDILWLYCNVQ